MSDQIVQSVNGTNVSHSLGEGTSKNLPKWMKTHLIAEHSPLEETSLDSSSHMVPYSFYLEETKLGKGKVAISPLISRSNVVPKQVSNGKTRDVGYKANITLDRYLPAFGRDRVSENRKCLGIGMFPGQCITEAETRKPCNDCDSQGRARVISKTNGETSSDLHHVSLILGQGKPKIESQPLSRSVDLDVKEKVRDLKDSKVSVKNEFSAETDNMETESYTEKKLHSGSCSTGSTKVLNKMSNRSSWLGLASSVKVESQQSNIELPDMNFPALPENTHPISSKKTRSLEMETLLGQDEYPNADPGMRWVKRLKLNSSNSTAQYRKISNLSENQSHENVSKSFSTIPESGSDHDKESHPSDNLIEDPSKKAKGLLLSHAWVQRWLSNRSRIAQTKPESLLACEPQGSRFALEKLERETCPSVAAMALMGKALTCFQPCDFQKRGSLTVWNTNAT